MIFKNRNMDRRLTVGLAVTMNHLADLDDAVHDADARRQSTQKRETAQKRELNRIRRAAKARP